VPDLPLEEAHTLHSRRCLRVSDAGGGSTSSKERIEAIASVSGIYLVSVTGVTGVRNCKPALKIY